MTTRAALLWFLSIAAFGCQDRPTPTGPFQSQLPSTDFFVPTFTALTLGETARVVVSADDPRCVQDPQYRCQYFRVTPPTDGTITILLAFSNPKGNLDYETRDGAGGKWDRSPTIVIRGGWTYEITVWEYEFPGLEYELTVSLQPR